MKTSMTTPNKSNGNSSKKTSTSPLSNDSSYSPTTMDEKNNNLVSKGKSMKISQQKKDHRLDENDKFIGKDFFRS